VIRVSVFGGDDTAVAPPHERIVGIVPERRICVYKKEKGKIIVGTPRRLTYGRSRLPFMPPEFAQRSLLRARRRCFGHSL